MTAGSQPPFSIVPFLQSYVLSPLLRIFITVVGASLRWRIDDPSGLLVDTPSDPMIFAFWHNRLFLMPYLFRKHWRTRQHDRVAVLVSASRDGEKLARVLRCFNLLCVRGSSSRRGKEALRELTRLVQQGYDAGITPDGPRGPKYRVQEGVISLAQLTGAPITPVSYILSRKIVFRSWDAFMLPWPLTRATLRIGAPMVVPPGDGQREPKRLELETTLAALSRED